jgi:DNA-binding SARP family transcriptional activator
MTTSLLQSIDPTLAEVVTGFSSQRARELIARTERLGLLSTRGTGRRGARRYHPLVREFLEARLRRTLGDEVARDLHRAVARHAGSSDWRLAAYHFAAADDVVDLGIVVQAAVPTIMGSGDFALAESYVQRAGSDNAAFELFVSRMELHRGRTDSALAHAELAVETAMRWDDEALADHALLNLIAVLHVTAQFETERDVAELLARRTTSATLRSIAQGVAAILDASEGASLDDVKAMLMRMAVEQEQGGHRHYVGITWLNIADIDCARGDADGALTASTRAVHELSASSAGIEVEGARVLRGWALAQQGRWQEAAPEFRLAESTQFDAVRGETLTDISEVFADLGGRGEGEAILSRAKRAPFVSRSTADRQQLVAAIFALRRGDLNTASSMLDAISLDRPHGIAAFLTRVRFVQARVGLAKGAPSAERDVARATHQAVRQGARTYAGSARILHASVAGPTEFSATVAGVAVDSPTSLSIIAEEIAGRLDDLEASALETVITEAERIPVRWREPLRVALTSSEPRTLFAAARILDKVGEHEDVPPLRRVAKTLRAIPGASSLGRGLARRLAARVFIEDQGRVQIQVGPDLIPGSTVRRKVLALLCFLLSRSNMSATRDQVLDGLWPDLEPEVAANSLNQTVYFLRRVFEPAFSEDVSPGYLHHHSDVIWLDPELVESRSVRSRAAVRLAEKDPSPDNVELLSSSYQGRFALDFAYEEWSAPYRDSLHAAYLEIIERAVSADTNAGEFDRAIGLARRALDADPEAEQVELSLLRLYRRTGAHSAAAEQYAHYAAVLRNDLGIEPPPLESL